MDVTLEDIQELVAQLPEDTYPEIYSLLREIIESRPAKQEDPPVKPTVPCIYCGSTHVVRNGKHDGKQAYVCRDCGKTFLETASSGISYSHHSEAEWKKVIRDTLDGVSIDSTAEALGTSHNTVFSMRHKVLSCVENAVSGQRGAPEVEAAPGPGGGAGEDKPRAGGQSDASPTEGGTRPDGPDGEGGTPDILRERIPKAHHISGKYQQRYMTFFEEFRGDPDEAVVQIYALMTERNHSYKTLEEIRGKNMRG